MRGFRYGIHISSSGSGHLIENMLLDLHTEIAISANSVTGIVVRSNQIYITGGTTFATETYGIYVSGASARILDNDISDTSRNSANTQSAYGLRVTASPAFIENNRVSNSQDYGIFSSNNVNVSLANNRINNSIAGGLTGLRTNTGSSIYKDNMVTGFTTAFSASVDGGGNVSAP